jgi:hypothetical protein
MTWKWVSTGRTCSTSFIQREVIQAHGHNGSNQKSAVTGVVDMGLLSVEVRICDK